MGIVRDRPRRGFFGALLLIAFWVVNGYFALGVATMLARSSDMQRGKSAIEAAIVRNVVGDALTERLAAWAVAFAVTGALVLASRPRGY